MKQNDLGTADMKDSSDDELDVQAREKILAAVDAGFDALELEPGERRQALYAATGRFPLIDLYDIVADWRGRFGAGSPYDPPLLKVGRIEINPSAPRYVHFKLKSVVLFLCEAAVALSASGGVVAAVIVGLAAARLSPEFRNLYRTFEAKPAQVLYEMYVLTNNGSRGVLVEQSVLCAAVNARLGCDSQPLITAAEFAAILGLLTDMKVLGKIGSQLRWK